MTGGITEVKGQALYARLLAADRRLQHARSGRQWARDLFIGWPSNETHDGVRKAEDEWYYATAVAQEWGLPNAPSTEEWAQHSRRAAA